MIYLLFRHKDSLLRYRTFDQECLQLEFQTALKLWHYMNSDFGCAKRTVGTLMCGVVVLAHVDVVFILNDIILHYLICEPA